MRRRTGSLALLPRSASRVRATLNGPAGAMAESKTSRLRVLNANEKRGRLELLAQVVTGLGHEVIAREIYLRGVGAVTARERPDVGLELHSEQRST